MITEAKLMLIALGFSAGLYMLGVLLWSIVRPEHRIWPPKKATVAIKIKVWTATVLIFVAAYFVGILDWNNFQWPAMLRWGVGLPLILFGNLIVWLGVLKIGFAATSGEATGLQTSGLYRWSRNPQYMADITIIIGWLVLSASFWVLPVLAIGLAVLIIAPLAEEPWLEEKYGLKYQEYMSRVRRYL